MIINRTYKYRIYPTKEQEAILRSWERTLVFLWNLCHRQRLDALNNANCSGREKIYLKSWHKDFNLNQSAQMTEMLPDNPWIAEVQCQARQKILSDLDIAWQRCFNRISQKPKFKNKNSEIIIYIPSSVIKFQITNNFIKFNQPQYKKLGALKLRHHRDIFGKVKSWSIKRSGSEWYAFAYCVIDINPKPVNNESIGIDLGVKNIITDSNGKQIPNPKFREKLQTLIARVQRQAANKVRGSNKQKKVYARLAKLKRLAVRQHEYFIHNQSKYYAENYNQVAVEDLKIKNMSASAVGTEKNHGKNIKQKSGLNREILNASWGKFKNQLKYKLEERSGKLIEVNPAYTSQTCNECKFVSNNNRKTQAEFCCVKCGFFCNADIVAAKNILNRGLTQAEKPAKLITKVSSSKRKSKISIST